MNSEEKGNKNLVLSKQQKLTYAKREVDTTLIDRVEKVFFSKKGFRTPYDEMSLVEKIEKIKFFLATEEAKDVITKELKELKASNVIAPVVQNTLTNIACILMPLITDKDKRKNFYINFGLLYDELKKNNEEEAKTVLQDVERLILQKETRLTNLYDTLERKSTASLALEIFNLSQEKKETQFSLRGSSKYSFYGLLIRMYQNGKKSLEDNKALYDPQRVKEKILANKKEQDLYKDFVNKVNLSKKRLQENNSSKITKAQSELSKVKIALEQEELKKLILESARSTMTSFDGLNEKDKKEDNQIIYYNKIVGLLKNKVFADRKLDMSIDVNTIKERYNTLISEVEHLEQVNNAKIDELNKNIANATQKLEMAKEDYKNNQSQRFYLKIDDQYLKIETKKCGEREYIIEMFPQEGFLFKSNDNIELVDKHPLNIEFQKQPDIVDLTEKCDLKISFDTEVVSSAKRLLTQEQLKYRGQLTNIVHECEESLRMSGDQKVKQLLREIEQYRLENDINSDTYLKYQEFYLQKLDELRLLNLPVAYDKTISTLTEETKLQFEKYNQNTPLFPLSPGSGKTTIAATQANENSIVFAPQGSAQEAFKQELTAVSDRKIVEVENFEKVPKNKNLESLCEQIVEYRILLINNRKLYNEQIRKITEIDLEIDSHHEILKKDTLQELTVNRFALLNTLEILKSEENKQIQAINDNDINIEKLSDFITKRDELKKEFMKSLGTFRINVHKLQGQLKQKKSYFTEDKKKYDFVPFEKTLAEKTLAEKTLAEKTLAEKTLAEKWGNKEDKDIQNNAIAKSLQDFMHDMLKISPYSGFQHSFKNHAFYPRDDEVTISKDISEKIKKFIAKYKLKDFVKENLFSLFGEDKADVLNVKQLMLIDIDSEEYKPYTIPGLGDYKAIPVESLLFVALLDGQNFFGEDKEMAEKDIKSFLLPLINGSTGTVNVSILNDVISWGHDIKMKLSKQEQDQYNAMLKALYLHSEQQKNVTASESLKDKNNIILTHLAHYMVQKKQDLEKKEKACDELERSTKKISDDSKKIDNIEKTKKLQEAIKEITEENYTSCLSADQEQAGGEDCEQEEIKNFTVERFNRHLAEYRVHHQTKYGPSVFYHWENFCSEIQKLHNEGKTQEIKKLIHGKQFYFDEPHKIFQQRSNETEQEYHERTEFLKLLFGYFNRYSKGMILATATPENMSLPPEIIRNIEESDSRVETSTIGNMAIKVMSFNSVYHDSGHHTDKNLFSNARIIAENLGALFRPTKVGGNESETTNSQSGSSQDFRVTRAGYEFVKNNIENFFKVKSNSDKSGIKSIMDIIDSDKVLTIKEKERRKKETLIILNRPEMRAFFRWAENKERALVHQQLQLVINRTNNIGGVNLIVGTNADYLKTFEEEKILPYLITGSRKDLLKDEKLCEKYKNMNNIFQNSLEENSLKKQIINKLTSERFMETLNAFRKLKDLSFQKGNTFALEGIKQNVMDLMDILENTILFFKNNKKSEKDILYKYIKQMHLSFQSKLSSCKHYADFKFIATDEAIDVMITDKTIEHKIYQAQAGLEALVNFRC